MNTNTANTPEVTVTQVVRRKIPAWLLAAAVALSAFYIWWELGFAVVRNWDQDTFLFSYNNAFLKMMAESGTFPQWNPTIQSGVSLTANMPFPLSLTKLMSLATGSGVLGYFFSRFFLLSIAALCLLGLLKKFQLRPLVSLFVLFLFMEYQLALYAHEAVPINVACVLIYSGLKFAQRKKFYIAGLAALYLGVALNDWVVQATLAVGLFQLFLVYFLRGSVNWKRHLSFVVGVWLAGLLLAVPTILPLSMESKESQKVLTYAQSNAATGNLFFDFLYYLKNAYLLRLSPGLLIPLALCFGAVPLYWRHFNRWTKGFVQASFLFFLALCLFNFFQPYLGVIPAVGGILKAFNPLRPSIAAHPLVVILCGLMIQYLIGNREIEKEDRVWRLGIFLAAFALLFVAFNYERRPPHFFGWLTKPNLILLAAMAAVVALFFLRHKGLRRVALGFVGAAFVLLWIFSGTRYYTRELPRLFNPFKPLPLDQVTIFPAEDPAVEKKLRQFLMEKTQKDFSQTAELRDFIVGDAMFQRYPDLQISTIHGWSNFRPLRAHQYYLWMLEDLKTHAPQNYEFLYKEGGFTYPFRSRFDTELLSFLGVKYLIGYPEEKDPRFGLVLQGETTKIFENKSAFPRAFLVPRARIFQTVEAMGDYLKSATLAGLAAEAAFLENDLEMLEEPDDFVEDFSESGESLLPLKSKATILKFSPNVVAIRVENDQPSILVHTQSYHRGWKAFVEDQPSPVIPANYAFLGTVVPSGVHTVRFQFSDPHFIFGLYVSGMILGLVVLVVLGSGLKAFTPKMALTEEDLSHTELEENWG